MLKLAVTCLANMVQECEMNMVSDGFSGAQLTTKSFLRLGLNITPEEYGLGKTQEGT